MQSTYLLEKVLKKSSLYFNAFCARCSILSYTRCISAVSIRRIDTSELHRMYDNMLQRAQNALKYKELIFSTFSNH